MTENAHKSLLQFVRYVFIGGFNTLSGYCVFAMLNWLMRGWGNYSYMYAIVLGSFITISVAFLGYKWFVFRTKGNYFAEWIRCFGVYGTSVLIGIAGMPILVPVLRHRMQRPELASYLAAGIMTVLTVVFGFLSHKNFSFRDFQRNTKARLDQM